LRSTYTSLRHWQADSGWRATIGRRAGAILLTIAAELIFLLLLLGLNPTLTEKPREKANPLSIDLSPIAPEPTPHPSIKRREIAEQRQAPKKPAPPAAPKLPYVPFSKSDMAAADISKLGSNAAKGDSSAQSASADGAGEGPGGAHLYRAEWYKEPSEGQIGFYLPKRMAEGSWAEIACRTVPKYHVEDCVLIGESPVGSGLARALRSASWQFLVRPPRIDGKPLVGSWVKIHFDFDTDAKG
jgi:protein TonB